MTNNFLKSLELNGRFPAISMNITPLGKTQPIQMQYFTEYHFSSSILVPVDAFSFSFSAPDDENAFTSYVKEGDIVNITANNQNIVAGLVDQIEVEVDGRDGEKATVHGRDLMGQLEDNAAVSIDAKPLWGESMTAEAVARTLILGTRIKDIELSDVPMISTPLATEPGESRLSALLRFLEPLNTLAWMSPVGKLVIGRPNFSQNPRGTIVCNKKNRDSNVLNIRAVYSSASIPNRIVVMWSEIQSTQIGIPKSQIFENNALGPRRLYNAGHNVIKTVLTSLPHGADAQSLASAAAFIAANGANATVIQALGKRELARANTNELIVQAVVPGHFNDSGEIYMPNTVYTIDFDRGGVHENMYLYEVDWHLTKERGQYTVLHFCKLGTIVSDVRVR